MSTYSDADKVRHARVWLEDIRANAATIADLRDRSACYDDHNGYDLDAALGVISEALDAR